MKIDTSFGDKGSQVVAYYDIAGERYYLFIANRRSKGANVARQDECTIVDNDARFIEEVINDQGQKLFVDSAALSDDLLARMIDHATGSIDEYFDRIATRQR